MSMTRFVRAVKAAPGLHHRAGNTETHGQDRATEIPPRREIDKFEHWTAPHRLFRVRMLSKFIPSNSRHSISLICGIY
jgi:hypothetical protein